MPIEGQRFRDVNDYAYENGYGAGFPNFHQARHDGELYYGTKFITPEAITGPVHVKASDLGNPQSDEERFRAVNNYAGENGYGAGFPNFHQARHEDILYYGTKFITHEAITGPVHVKASEITPPLDDDPPETTDTTWTKIQEEVKRQLDLLDFGLGNEGYVRVEKLDIHDKSAEIEILLRYKQSTGIGPIKAKVWLKGKIDISSPLSSDVQLCTGLPPVFGKNRFCMSGKHIAEILALVVV